MLHSTDNARTRRVLVTGASGFVGQWVIAALHAAGYSENEIFCAVQADAQLANTAPETIAFDVADRAAAARAISALRPNGVIHLAGIAAPAQAGADPKNAWRVNVDGVLHVVDAALEARPDATVIFAGSAEAYGDSFAHMPDGKVNEDAPLRPRTAYASTKAAAEMYLSWRKAAGARIFVFRAFNHTGPGQSPDFVVPAFAQQIARIEHGQQEPVINVGNLDAMRDFIDVRDVARAYVNALDPAAKPGVFNLASGRARRIGDLLEALLGLARRPVDVRIDPARLRGPEIASASGDAGRAARGLNWTPQIAFEQTLEDVLDDWRDRVAS